MSVPATFAKKPTTKSEPILFVDDDLSLLAALRRLYRKEFDIHLAGSASEALYLLENDGPFAVVVTDYHMPHMDGVTFLCRARKIAPDVVRILLTGNSDAQVATDAVNQGEVFRFLRKPCKAKALTAVLRVALDHYRLRQDEIELATTTRNNFITTVSHELQTPITCIRASAEILLSSVVDEVTREEILKTIAMESDLLSRLIQQILDTSEIAAGEVALDIESLDLAGVIHAAAMSVQGVGKVLAVEIHMNVIDDARGFAGDSRRLIQAFGNLIGNAIKVTSRGGTINVELDRNATGFEVRVADCGPGVADEMKEHIFERFVQCAEILTKKPRGAGLGLAIARDVIEMHGGTIRCEDNPRGGAVFVVELPLGGLQQST